MDHHEVGERRFVRRVLEPLLPTGGALALDGLDLCDAVFSVWVFETDHGFSS